MTRRLHADIAELKRQRLLLLIESNLTHFIDTILATLHCGMLAIGRRRTGRLNYRTGKRNGTALSQNGLGK